jgi:hypothetical protein
MTRLRKAQKKLERLECPSKLTKRGHNQANNGLREIERPEGKAQTPLSPVDELPLYMS